jgi:tetratricopeptide (TPR) repeat protein
VAELLTLKAELPPGQVAAARRLAGLLARTGEISAAIDVLSANLGTAPRDIDLLVDLAALQAEAGRMIEARSTLRRAASIEPRRADVAERLAVLNHVLALDPTLAGLRLVTRANRARLLLAQVLDHTRACTPQDDTDIARERADAERRMRRRAPITAETADQAIELAARLWKAAPACHGETPEARAIGQVLQRIESSAEPPS